MIKRTERNIIEVSILVGTFVLTPRQPNIFFDSIFHTSYTTIIVFDLECIVFATRMTSWPFGNDLKVFCPITSDEMTGLLRRHLGSIVLQFIGTGHCNIY